MVRDIANKKGGAPEARRRPDREDQINMLNISHGEEPGKPNGRAAPSRKSVSNTDFAEQLRQKIEMPGTPAERWRITPKMAAVMLEWNDRNRPLSEKTVKKYASIMRAGRWHYTGTPIVFSRQRLIDGQNRLHAAVSSGCTIDALVVFGVPDESFAFIDIGKSRSASDIFSIHGIKNNAAMAAATQWIVAYESGNVAGAVSGYATRGDHDELYQSYLAHAGLQDSMWVCGLFSKARFISPSMMCAIHYICAKKNRALADEFFRKVGEGLGFSGKKDQAYRLHKALIDAAVAGQKLGRKAGAAITIKAWNATRLGRDAGTLKFSPDETFPKVI